MYNLAKLKLIRTMGQSIDVEDVVLYVKSDVVYITGYDITHLVMNVPSKPHPFLAS